MTEHLSNNNAQGGRFPTTHWSVVYSARDGVEEDAAHNALAELCRIYWAPIYTYIRRTGCPPEDAQDRTQSFFLHILSKSTFDTANPDKGRLRSFLLGALKHHLASEFRRENAEKRGGQITTISVDMREGEEWLTRESDRELSPDKQYDRTWALTALDKVMNRMEADYAARQKDKLFTGIKGHLLWNSDATPIIEIAKELSMTEGSIRVAIHHMRKRYRKTLQREILETVATPEDAEIEIQHLRDILSGN